MGSTFALQCSTNWAIKIEEPHIGSRPTGMITSSFHVYSCNSKSLSFKGNFLECTPGSVHCTITHLPVISKIFGRVLTIRIKKGVDNIFRKELTGFGENRSTIDQTGTSQRMDCTSVHPKAFAGFYASRKAMEHHVKVCTVWPLLSGHPPLSGHFPKSWCICQ